MAIPLFFQVIQALKQPTINNVAGETRKAWLNSRLPKRISPGAKVAIAVGSRGIRHLATIVQATVSAIMELNAHPFIVAAMGSHGGATPEGQRELLAEYGITESALGVSIRSEMDTVEIGTNAWGEPVHWDKNAWHADAVVAIARVKAHTDFRARYESGIVKMLAIGLGKRTGAAQHHRWGVRGLREMMPETARVIVDRSRFAAGLAIVENSDEDTAMLRVLDRDEVFEEEPQVLEQAKLLMGRLPVDQLDLLVIGEIGKNFSGAGIDPNVVGRLFMEAEPEFESPKITRICALDLAPESHGNATGIGLADLTTSRLLGRIDPHPTRMNQMTACSLLRSKIPFDHPNDRQCIEAGVATCWQPHSEKIRMAIIPNTLELAELWVSPSVAEQLRLDARMKVADSPRELPFDADGNVNQGSLFPHALIARRRA